MPQTLPRYAFGPFTLDPAERRLLRHGRPVALYPKALDVLAVLVARAGHLVTKDELLAAVWPGVVVEENALSAAVSRLRAALGAEGRGYVETVPGHGYRFVAPVAAVEADEGGIPRSGAYGTGGPRVEDVVPTVSPGGDGVAPPAPAFPPPSAWGRLRPGPLGLVAGAVVLVVVALALAGPRDRPSEADGLPAAAPHRAEAEAAYRRGRALWDTRRNLDAALAEFHLAAQLDATYAPAYLGQADVYVLGLLGDRAQAEAAAHRALELDPTLGEAYATLGFARALYGWDWAGAEADFRRALALAPDYPTAHQWYATVLMIQRRFDEAEAALDRAITLAPRGGLYADLCQLRYYRRAYAAAYRTCAQALALDPGSPFALEFRAWAALELGRVDEAARAFEDLGIVFATPPSGRAAILRAFPQSPPGEAQPNHHVHRARRHAALGERAAALAALEAAVARRAFWAPFANADPVFDPLRDEPRFRAALRRMGLE